MEIEVKTAHDAHEKFDVLQKEPGHAAQAPRSELRLNYAWIKRHGGEHAGRWAALRGGELIAVADSQAEVVQLAHGRSAGPFLIAQL